MNEIVIKPVGKVLSDIEDPAEMTLGGKNAIVEIYPQYEEALQGITENSHVWILAWFHKADRNFLKSTPSKVNAQLPEYGVFGLRAFNRPNPVGMCLARLEKVDGRYLYVSGLDAVGGTPVIDIKPYYENDIVFSPLTPYIKGRNRKMRQGFILKRALTHHQEECSDLHLAVRMAAIAEDELGKLNEADLKVEVTGTACLADCIQGITGARLANPARFNFVVGSDYSETMWLKGDKVLKIKARKKYTVQELKELEDEELFCVTTHPESEDTCDQQ
jgi:tRNA-Thr(GGU) m(6)t(6)A37 methyltransferase TsaA